MQKSKIMNKRQSFSNMHRVGVGSVTVDLPEDVLVVGDHQEYEVLDLDRLDDPSYTARVVVVAMNHKSSSSWALECCIRDFLDASQDVLVLVHVQPCREQVSSYMGAPIYRSRFTVNFNTVHLLQHYARVAHQIGGFHHSRIKLKALLSDLHPGDAISEWLAEHNAESIVYGPDVRPRSRSTSMASLLEAPISMIEPIESKHEIQVEAGPEFDAESGGEMMELLPRQDLKLEENAMLNRVVVVVGKSIRNNVLLSLFLPFFQGEMDQHYEVIRGGIDQDGRQHTAAHRLGWTHTADMIASKCSCTCWIIHEQSGIDNALMKLSQISRQVCSSMF
jgi:hypothetical protein